MTTDRLRRLVPLLCALLCAPALEAQESGSGVSVGLRAGVAGGGVLCVASLLPGAEVHTGGPVYGVAVLDTYLFRARDRDPCETERTPEGREEVTRVPVTAPRMRVGAGWATPLGADVRVYLGQQGVLEGFQPLAGAALGLGRGAWAVELGGTLHRADVYERVPIPGTELFAERPLRREWVPSFEAAARVGVGRLAGGGPRREPGPPDRDRTELWRPVVGGIVGGTAGAAAGFVGGLVGARGCEGDEICLIPALVGAVIGETLGVPLGVHVAEGRRGSYPLGALASLGVTAAGLGAISVLGDSGAPAQGVSVLVPIAQIWASTVVERRTAR